MISVSQKIRRWYLSLSIKYKMLILFYGIIVLTSVMLSFTTYFIFIRQIEEEMSNVISRDTKRVANSIDFMQKDLTELSTYLCLDPAVQNFVLDNQNYLSSSFESLSHLLASKDYISFIIIYSLNGKKYYISNDNSSEIIDLNQWRETKIFENIINSKGSPIWINLNKLLPSLIITNKYPKIAMARAILNLNTLEPAGILIMCINIPILEKMCLEDFKEKDVAFSIIDEANDIVMFRTTSNKIKKSDLTSFLQTYAGESLNKSLIFSNSKLLISYSPITNSNWQLISIVSLENMINKVKNSIISTNIEIMVLCLVFAFIISIYFSSLLTSPLQRLVYSMERVKDGYLKEKVYVRSPANDEISKLILKYNDMIEKMNELINKVYKLEINKKEAELKALEAQINPHFLYNTLDTIFWKAEKANYKEISEMIYALSKLFRLTLNRGSEFITIRGEKELIENYLFLQSMRYKNRLIYEIDISEDILGYHIPKLIIQPFVENAIVHGIENTDLSTVITIKGYKENNNLCFKIKDTGVGMNDAKLFELKDMLNSRNDSNKGYAIKNVNERLKLYYSDKFSLEIKSQVGKGTEVVLILPIEDEEKIEKQKTDEVIN